MPSPAGIPPEWLAQAVRDELARRCALRTEQIGDKLLLQAIGEAAREAGHASIDEFATAIRGDVDNVNVRLLPLLRRVTVGETTFFRHREDIAWLRDTALPALVARHDADGSRRLRLWSAGCASGEEAYSLAALALEAVPDPGKWDVRVLATDINDSALLAAERAEYGPWSFREVDPGLREAWFEPCGRAGGDERWKPVERLRRLVTFHHLNLRDPIYPAMLTGTTHLDLIVCRNVFIYFFANRVMEVLARFAECLDEGGYLLCGPSDLLHLKDRIRALAPERAATHRMQKTDAAVVVPAPPRPPSASPRPLGTRRIPAPTPPPATRPLPTPASAAPRPAPAADPVAELFHVLGQGRFADALATAERLATADPTSVEIARARALALQGAGRDAEAIEAWRRVLYLAPTDAGAHLGVGLLLVRDAKNEARAAGHFRAVVRELDGVPDETVLPGPDRLLAGWVRETCRALVRGAEA